MFKLITQLHLQKCAPTLLLSLILSGCGGSSDADSETQISEEQETPTESTNETESSTGSETSTDNESSTDSETSTDNESSTGSESSTDTESSTDIDSQAPDMVDSQSIGNITKTQILLANDAKNAPEHDRFVSYLGTGKSIDGNPKEQIPFRTYTAACALDTDEPRLFVSMTLDDQSDGANPDNPRVGSVFEAKLNPTTGALEPTSNQTLLPMCNESHGIAVSSDCSTIGLLCATDYEQPVSATFDGEFTDLVATMSNDATTVGGHINNETLREENHLYNGEMWLLEWQSATSLQEAPNRYVIHKGVGGHEMGTTDLILNEQDNSYAASFTTAVFDNGGGRHRSAALMVIDRETWSLNPDRRGWPWACGYGHVFFIRPFWNPFMDNRHTDQLGGYGALCTSDGNDWSLGMTGTVAIKYEDSDYFEGYTNYVVASSNSGVSVGAGHKVIPVDEQRTIGLLVAPDAHPWSDEEYFVPEAIEAAEQAAVNHLGEEQALAQNLTGLNACNWWQDGGCLWNWARWEYSYDHGGRYPLFPWGFWYKDEMDERDLSRIGIFHSEHSGKAIFQADGSTVKWIAQDDDCMLGAPQMVDLQNGRYLVGFGKFQCKSDGFKVRRFATNTVNTRSVATLIPSEYYLMEIDADGNVLVEPTLVSGSGWGGVDMLTSFGEGRAAWAYIPNPQLTQDGHPEPAQNSWELLIYESPLD